MHVCIQRGNPGFAIDSGPIGESTATESFVNFNIVMKKLIEYRKSRRVPIICILDCCRTNIKERWLSHDSMASLEDGGNTYILYASANGQAAANGDEDGNGAFTELLLKNMDAARIEDLAVAVSNDMMQKYGSSQFSCTYGSLTTAHYSFPSFQEA